MYLCKALVMISFIPPVCSGHSWYIALVKLPPLPYLSFNSNPTQQDCSTAATTELSLGQVQEEEVFVPCEGSFLELSLSQNFQVAGLLWLFASFYDGVIVFFLCFGRY